jgi:hypothetical protein
MPIKALIFWPMVFGLMACSAAVRMEKGVAQSPMVFQSPPAWELVKNKRVFRNRLVVFEAPDDCCFIRVEALYEGQKARALPLDIVADVHTLGRGRNLGVHMELLGSQDILVAERQAWATTYRYTHGPHARTGSSVYLRGGPYLVVLTLQGLDTMPVAVVPIWDAFLESVDLPEWEAEDVPLFAPETDPGLKVFLGE